MRKLNLSARILSFALILVLLTIRIGSFTDETFVYPVQDVIFKTAHISSEEAKQKTSGLKTKRTAGDIFCSAAQLQLDFFPLESRLTPSSPYKALPEVYLDIFIPPDEPA
jgi:hypothetical protein